MTKITKKIFLKALEASNGTPPSVIERIPDIKPSTFYSYLGRNPEMKELMEEKRLENVKIAESVIFENLRFNEGKPHEAAKIRNRAAEFIVERLGKDEGWVQKTQLEHSGSAIDSIKLEVIDKTEDVRSNNSDKSAV